VKLRYDQRSKVLQPSEQVEWLQIYTPEGQKTNPDSKHQRKHSELRHFRAISMKVCATKITNICISESQTIDLLPSLWSSVPVNLTPREVETTASWGLLTAPCLAGYMTMLSTQLP
jgi:hypothetical protein